MDKLLPKDKMKCAVVVDDVRESAYRIYRHFFCSSIDDRHSFPMKMKRTTRYHERSKRANVSKIKKDQHTDTRTQPVI